MTQRVVNYTYGTGNPVLPDGSIDVRDGIDNLQSFDIFMNADEDTYNQRDGGIVKTRAGAVRAVGIQRVGDFNIGCTVTERNQGVLYETDGTVYVWLGALPKVVPPASSPSTTGGTGPSGWLDIGDANIRSDLSSTGGASIVNTSSGDTVQQEIDMLKSFPATGSEVPYTQQDRARRQLSASDFTPEATDLGAAVNAVRTSLETEYSPSALVGVRGGDCFLPRGTHASLTPINLERRSSGTTSFSLRGQGQSTTQLDMTGAPTFTDGITGGVGGATFGKLCDFGIKKAPRNGLRLEKYSRMTFESLEMREGGSDGFYFGNGFVTVLEKLTATGNAAAGFNFAVTQQHTSHTINGGFAFQNAGPGWVLGCMNYSVTNGQASDNNGSFGYLIAKCNGFVMNGPGAESNARSAFGVLANSTNGSTRNTVIDGAFAYHNGLAGEGYGNLLYVSAADGETADVLIANSESIPTAGSTAKDIIVTGVGATATIYNCTMPNGWESRNGGYVHWVHKTLLVNNLTVPVAPTATPICNLRSSQGHNVRYAGEITVLASNIQPSTGERNIAIYKLLVCKSIAGGNQVIEISKAGHTAGSGVSSPAFSWSLVSDRLVATPLGAAGGIPFWFEIDASSQIVALSM